MSPRIEDRLCDAFAVGAELVRAETLRPIEESMRAKVIAPRRGFVLAIPLAAALVVAVISAVVVTVAGIRAPAPAGPAAKTLSGPRFLLAAHNDGVTVRDAQTGRITGRVGLPRAPEGGLREPGGYLLAGTGEGTTFYVAQSVTSRQTQVSTTWFHQVRVDERGRVAELVGCVLDRFGPQRHHDDLAKSSRQVGDTIPDRAQRMGITRSGGGDVAESGPTWSASQQVECLLDRR
jgi:hypothetical protein